MANPIQGGYTDYDAERENIARQQQYAQLLMQQSQEALPNGSMVGDRYVPTAWTQQLAQALKAPLGAYAQKQATERSKQLNQDYQQGALDTMKRGIAAQYGAPERVDYLPDGVAGPPKITPAVQADPAAAAAIYMSHPATQGMAMQTMQDVRRNQLLAQLLRGGQGGTTPGVGGNSLMPGESGGIPSGAGGVLGTVSPSVLAMILSGDPSLMKVGEMMQDANKPVALREGDLVRPGANGQYQSVYQQPKLEAGMVPVRDQSGQVIGARPLPGYAGGAASIKGAEAGATEGARARYDMVTINTPQGPMMVTRSQAAQMAGGAGMSPQDQQAIGAFVNRDPSKPFNMTVPSGNQGIGIPLQGEAGKASETERGKFFGQNYADLQKGAMDANTKIAKLDRMASLLDGVNTGKLTPAGTELAAYGQSLGLNIDPKLGNKQAAVALANEIALQLRNPSGGAGMPGALSDRDREFLMSMTPSLASTPEGNRMLIEGMKKLSQREQDIAQLARNYKGGNLDNGFYQVVQDYANKNPLFQAPTGQPSAPSGVRKFNPATGKIE